VKFAFMCAEKAHFPLSFMCRMLEVSRSGYYAWLGRPESRRRRDDRRLVVHIQNAFAASRHNYGSPRIYRELRALGVSGGRHRIARLMRSERLQARRRRRFVCTTDSDHQYAPAPNLLERRFEATAPDLVWASDITYVPTEQGWLFLAVVMDLFSRRIIGWSMSHRIDAKLALDALEMALSARNPDPGLLHHSDRGLQYTCEEYRQVLEQRGFVVSMSRRGNCWDNAAVESFFSSLKTELVHRTRFATREEARAALFEYLETFYNRRRLHSALGYCSPEEYEEKAA
jgi:putative transposase